MKTKLELSDEQLDMIKEMGSNAATFKAVARVIEVPFLDFKKEMMNEYSPAYKAYHAGSDLLDMKAMKTAVKAMERGSLPALNAVIKRIEATKKENT